MLLQPCCCAGRPAGMSWTNPLPHSRPFTLSEQSTGIQIYHSKILIHKTTRKPPNARRARSAGARPSEGEEETQSRECR